MIIYEVRIHLEPAIAAAYRSWLDQHVHQILSIPGFNCAELLQEEADVGAPVLVVRYHLDSRQALSTYLRDHAPALRADATARFGDRFKATRRVLELVRVFP